MSVSVNAGKHKQIDPKLQEVADKILHELPEELAAAIRFEAHESGGLKLVYPRIWHSTPEMELLDTAARRYKAGFVNHSPNESYYLISPTNSLNETGGKSASTVPLDMRTDSQIFDEVCKQLAELNTNLTELIAVVQKIADRPISRGDNQLLKKELPVERHVDGNIIWLYDTNRVGEQYEKALAEENRDSPEYKALERMLFDAATAGKKGLLQDGKWYFLSTQKDWIGRKLAKDFSKGGNMQ